MKTNLETLVEPRGERPTCYRCRRPQLVCFCADVRRVDNRTEVLIVQHPRERRHPFGTARIAALSLSRVRLTMAARDGERWSASDPGFEEPAALLFPGTTATVLDIEAADPLRLRTLVLVDGTWPNAAKLVRDNPWLQALPRVALRPTQPGRYRIRKARRPDVQLSTIEAISAALHVLEPDTPSLGALLMTFEAMVDRQIEIARHRRSRETARRVLPRATTAVDGE